MVYAIEVSCGAAANSFWMIRMGRFAKRICFYRALTVVDFVAVKASRFFMEPHRTTTLRSTATDYKGLTRGGPPAPEEESAIFAAAPRESFVPKSKVGKDLSLF
jgi:hypothetical protein